MHSALLSPGAAVLRPSDTTAPRSVTARGTLVGAAGLGIAADALLRNGPVGLAFPVWIGILVATFVALVWREGRTVPTEARWWLVVATLASAGVAWRDSEELGALNVFATLFALGMTSLSLAGSPVAGLFAARVRDAIWSAAAVARDSAAAFVPLVFRDAIRARTVPQDSHRRGALISAVALAAVLVLFFGNLLAHGDPLFASVVTIPAFDASVPLSHLAVAGFFAWIVGGWTHGALGFGFARTPAPDALPGRLDTLQITVVLGALNVLFGLFLVTQLGWLFGGDAVLKARTGLTVAEYARRGFFELVWVTLLVIPVLLATRAVTSGDDAAARRHTQMAVPMIGLVGAMVVSAAARMRLYVGFYGLTTDRFYAAVFMAWLALVLVWLGLTLLRDWGRPFVGGAVVVGLLGLGVLNVVNPDAVIARVNLARAAERSPANTNETRDVDLKYLARLSGDAAPLVVRAVLAGTSVGDRCHAAALILRDFGPASERALRLAKPAGWRAWNADAARAIAAVSANRSDLSSTARGCEANAVAGAGR
jgi:hypothetical protein